MNTSGARRLTLPPNTACRCWSRPSAMRRPKTAVVRQIEEIVQRHGANCFGLLHCSREKRAGSWLRPGGAAQDKFGRTFDPGVRPLRPHRRAVDRLPQAGYEHQSGGSDRAGDRPTFWARRLKRRSSNVFACRRRPKAPTPSLQAKRSNPSRRSGTEWIASSLRSLAQTLRVCAKQ